jgi:hypothetical protein
MTTHTDDSLGSIPVLPCPFCGVTLEVNDNRRDLYVRRYGTHYQHPINDCYLSDTEVTPSQVAEWNRRPAPAAAVRLTEPMVEAAYQVFVAEGWKVGLHELRGTLRKAIPAAITLGAAAVRVPERDEITVNLVRLAGLDKHKARECEEIVRQVLSRGAAAPAGGETTLSDAQCEAIYAALGEWTVSLNDDYFGLPNDPELEKAAWNVIRRALLSAGARLV